MELGINNIIAVHEVNNKKPICHSPLINSPKSRMMMIKEQYGYLLDKSNAHSDRAGFTS